MDSANPSIAAKAIQSSCTAASSELELREPLEPDRPGRPRDDPDQQDRLTERVVDEPPHVPRLRHGEDDRDPEGREAHDPRGSARLRREGPELAEEPVALP